MINIHVSNNNACAKCGALLTSGMVGAHCAFNFGAEWAGLAKTAVFIAGNVQKDVLLTENECVIPWEVLEKQGYQLYIGVYGTNENGDLVIPTIYVNVGVIKKGADPNGEEGADPTPTVVEQIIAAAGTAVNIANSVREDADNGVFDGRDGQDGRDGVDGRNGADAKINGYNTVNIVAGDNITIDQEGNTLTINGEAGGGGGGTSDHRQLSNRDAANQHPISAIDGLQTALNGKQPVISDLQTIRSGASKGSTAVQPESGKGLFSGNYNDLTNKPTIPSAVTESTVSGWGFTKNTGTYSKPSTGIPKTDLASEVQTSLGKADTALQESHVFVAEYGVTPFATIKQQYEKNFVVQIYRQISGRMLVLDIVDVSDTIIRFGNISGGDSYSASVTSANVWANSTDTFQVTRNRVTSISSASTDAQYPSAKAVYNHHDTTKQDKLTAGDNVTIENNVISAAGGGEEWELINVIEPTEEASALHITKDSNGNSFDLKKALLLAYFPQYTGTSDIPPYCFASVNNITAGPKAPLIYTDFILPNKSQGHSMYWMVETAQSGKPYHEYYVATDLYGQRRAIGGAGRVGPIDYYCDDGTEPAPYGITEIGTVGNFIYSGCYFALYGVRK